MVRKSIVSLLPILLFVSSGFGFKQGIKPFNFRINVLNSDLVTKVRYQFDDNKVEKLKSFDVCLSKIHTPFRVWVEGYKGEFEWRLQSGCDAQLKISKKGKDTIVYRITYYKMGASGDTVYIDQPDKEEKSKPSKTKKTSVKKSRK
jgi:hypothetical protein